MNPQAIQQLQASLGVPVTGVLDAATSAAMNAAVSKSLSANKDVQTYAGNNDPNSILQAYISGDWSGVTSLSGKPFTDAQQKAAVAQATTALAPAYNAQKTNDTATTEDSLRSNQENLSDFEAGQGKQFGQDKNALDQNSADSGVLFSGSRFQKLNDLRTTYANADANARRNAAENAATTARGYAYDYGSDAAKGLSGYYSLPGATTYNANVAGGQVTPSRTLSAAYDPNAYAYQGTKPVAQTTAIQTRAATLLANKANKLSLSGYGTKF